MVAESERRIQAEAGEWREERKENDRYSNGETKMRERKERGREKRGSAPLLSE